MTAQQPRAPVPPFNMRAYQYQTISSTSALEIVRVFDLAPGSPADPIIGSLREMDIASPQSFEALSYVWGPDETTEDIICDDASLSIRANVARILRKIRDPVKRRTIWVDQVSINQLDLYERSKQVRHMNTIYRKASRVLVCLGDDDRNGHAERAFDLIQELATFPDNLERRERFQTEQRELDTTSPPRNPSWESLAVLFRQSWFDRKWILQEIGTDAAAELLWSNAHIEWSKVASVATFLKNHGYGFRRAYNVLVWKPYYMDKLFSAASYADKKDLLFAYELHRARWQNCGDPRDHIFALLGHPAAVDPVSGKRWIEADYTRGLEEIYHETAVRLLADSRTLMMLNVVQHESLEKARQRDIPSWVPQWDDQACLHNLLGDDICVFNPSRDLRPALQLTNSDRVLSSPGLVIDTITTTSQVFVSSDFTTSSTTIGDLWAEQPECDHQRPQRTPTFTTTHKYRNSSNRDAEPALLAFLETLSAVKKRRPDPLTPLQQRQADGAAFIASTYSTSGLVGKDIITLSRSGNDQRWLERVSGGAKGRRFARGQKGFYALVPPAAEVGDRLCLLFGGKTLYCLRPREVVAEKEKSYWFVGECYVHGVMDGEALDMMERGELVKEVVEIW